MYFTKAIVITRVYFFKNKNKKIFVLQFTNFFNIKVDRKLAISAAILITGGYN